LKAQEREKEEASRKNILLERLRKERSALDQQRV